MANLAEMIKTLDLTGLDVVPVEGEVRDLVQARLLEMLDDVNALCREQGIPWMMGGGSALGAVRHRGFIPWDDDMDVAMLRPEYERFLSACQTDLGPRFQCQTCRTDPDYPYGFGKILLKNSRFVMAGHEGERWQKGVFVDVFPIDGLSDADDHPRNRLGLPRSEEYNPWLFSDDSCRHSSRCSWRCPAFRTAHWPRKHTT